MIEEICGLDYERFSRSVLLSQGDFAAFLRSDERERSELLERITGTEVYSQLSIAAYDRFREESRKLENLQEQLKQLELLDEDPVDEQQLKALEKDLQDARKELEDLRKQLQRLERWEQLQARERDLQTEQEQLAAHVAEFQQDRERFERSKALFPLVGALEEEGMGKLRVETLENERAALLETDESEKSRLETVQEEFEELEKELQQLRSEQTKQSKIWTRVDRLDHQISTLSDKLADRRQGLVNSQAESERLEEELRGLEKARQSQTEEREGLGEWLKKNQPLAGLAKALPTIEQLREQLLENYQSIRDVEQEQQQNKMLLEQWQKQTTTLTEDLEKAKQHYETLTERFRSLLPDQFDPSRKEAVQRLNSAIDQLQERRQVVSQLAEMDLEYQRLLQEQSVYDERLEQLLTLHARASKEVLSMVDQQETFREQLEYKRHIYEQQQIIANYEKDRQQLKPGDPCPLCQSTDHPFRDHPVTPYVDKAKEEWEEAKRQAEKLLQAERKWLQEEAELNREIESLRGNELEAVQGRLQQHLQKIESYEKRMAGLLVDPQSEIPLERGNLLKQQLEQMEDQLLNWRKVRQDLQDLSGQLEEFQSKEQQLEKDLLSATAKLESTREQEERLGKQMERLKKKMEDYTEQANKVLQPFNHQFELKTAKKMFVELREQASSFEERKDRQVELERLLAVGETEYKNLLKEKQKGLKALEDLGKQIGDTEEQLGVLKEERSDLFDERSVETEREAFDSNWQEKLTLHEEVTQKRAGLREDAAARRRLLEEKAKEQKREEKELSKVRTSLLKSLKTQGYTSIEAARAVRLSPEEEVVLEEQLKALDRRQAEWERSQKEWQKEWEELAMSEDDIEQARMLKVAFVEKEEGLAERQKQFGQLTEKFEQQEKRREQHGELLQTIEVQRKEFNRWAQLNEIIGQADGKKFRTYAQGLTLQKLVALANYHLEQLNGRYLIHKRIETDLELEIIDTYQADNRRSMYTLSGGETFLISLALALGLSDLAGRNVRIESLFIDEGFGSLDENSLDIALTTLENLQSSGKTIGIISHVKLLKERIGTQVQVQKHSTGFSSLQLVG